MRARSAGITAHLVGSALVLLSVLPAQAQATPCPDGGFEGALCLTDRALGTPFCGPLRLEKGVDGHLRKTRKALVRAEAAHGRGNAAKMAVYLTRAGSQLDGLSSQAARLWIRHKIGTLCRFSLDHMVKDLRNALAGITGGTTTTTVSTTTTLAGDGTTTTTISPAGCPGTITTAAQPVSNPAYPDCVSISWPTPAALCQKNLRSAFFDADTGEQLTSSPLFLPYTHWSGSFSCPPPECNPGVSLATLRVVFKVCNHQPDSPGGGSRSIFATVSWD